MLSRFSIIRRRMLWTIRGAGGAAAAAQALAGRILTILLSMFNGVVVARHLGPAGRGDQAALMLWPQLLPAALTLGLPYAVIYHARSTPEKKQRFYGVAFASAIFLGLAACAIGRCGVPQWLHRYNGHIIAQSRELMLFALIFALIPFMSSILESEHSFSRANILRYLPTVLTTICLSTLWVTHAFSPLTASLAYFIPTALVALLLLPKIILLLSLKPQAISSVMRPLFSYGFRVYGTNLLGLFSQQIDQMLVVGFLSPTELGVYVVCLSASRVLNLFETSLATVMLPKTAGKAKAEVASIVSLLGRLTFALSGGAAVILALLIPWVLPAVYGHEFRLGIATTEVLLLESVIGSTTNVLLQAYLAVDRPAVVTLFQLIGLAVAVPLLVLMIPRYGLVGAATALLASTSLRYVFARYGYRYILCVPIPKLSLSASDLRFVINAFSDRLVRTSA